MRILPEVKDAIGISFDMICKNYFIKSPHKKKVEQCSMCKKDAETNIIVGDGELMPVCLKCAKTFDGRL